ncbi:MAG: DUF4249 domain-containing protein [Prevotellaceae bacterium]|jgi:hypothetical protein|nr:DUF4249 domain-containing protein [Prevotellaceae bacterium]
MKLPPLFLPFALTLAGACVERVDIDTNSQNPKLVVMAMLTTDVAPQLVTLTQSTNFFGGDTCPAVTGAKVWINDERLMPIDAAKGSYATRSSFTVTPGKLYKLRILYDMNNDGTDEEFWAEDVAPHAMSLLQTITTPINMDNDTSKYAPPFIISALIQRENVNENYIRVTQQYQGKKRTENLAQYVIGSVPYGFADLLPAPAISTITRSGFLLDGQPDTVFYCPFDTVSLRLNTMSDALYRYISSAQAESRGSSNPMFGGAPANAESNIYGGNVVGCFGIYAAGKPANIVLPMNAKTLDSDSEWFNLSDTTLRITIQNEGIATYCTGARKGEIYFKMANVDPNIKGFWAYRRKNDGIPDAKFEMKSYDEFWGDTDNDKWRRWRGWR